MKTIHVTETFDGYPQGGKAGEKPRRFLAGETAEVSDAFADLVAGKGHAQIAADAESAEKKGRGK